MFERTRFIRELMNEFPQKYRIKKHVGKLQKVSLNRDFNKANQGCKMNFCLSEHNAILASMATILDFLFLLASSAE